ILGGAIGCFVAFGGLPLLKDLGANAIPRLDEVGIDFTVLGFTLTLSALTGILFGLFPALRWSRASEIHVIKAAMGGKSAPQRPFHGFVVVIEVAMAVVLLIGGGLLLRSFFKLSHVDPGFDARNVLMF